jgi:hypothetical protein
MLYMPFLPHQNSGDLVLGHLWRFPISPLFRVTASARTAHLYVIGMSGKGKSKLLESCLYQDIAAGRSCGLIDPHSLLVDDLLRLLITRRVLDNPDIRNRLIYVDPARTDYVIPFNVLATAAEHPYDVAAAVLEAFRRTWPECLREAPHFSNVVTAALIVLIENGLTLMHMPRLLTNSEFREQCLERVTDGDVVVHLAHLDQFLMSLDTCQGSGLFVGVGADVLSLAGAVALGWLGHQITAANSYVILCNGR